MTRAEAKDILINRVGFIGETSLSGKTFEGENAIIQRYYIKASQPDEYINEGELNEYLTRLKTEVVYQVLSDVFDSDNIKDEVLSFYPALFDNAISMQMLIKVVNLVLSSTRSSVGETIGKAVMQRLFFDLKGNKGSEKYPITDGIEHKYRSEIRRVKNKTNTQRRFKTITNI